MKAQFAQFKKKYSGKQDTIRFFLHDMGNMIQGYYESPGSNQQQIMRNGVELYNSDFNKLNEKQLISLLVKTVDFSKLHVKKPQYILREIDSRPDVQVNLGKDAPYMYASFNTKDKAEEFASVKKTFPYITSMELMKEKYPDQYPNRDYTLIRKIK